MDLRLIANDSDGKYRVNEGESIETLRSFLLLRGLLIPRLTIYAGILTGILGSYLLLYPWRGDFRDLTVLAVILFSIIAFSFEALKQYRGLKISLRDVKL
jgi:hypothetical protein